MSVRFSRRQFLPLAAAAMASCARRNDANVLNIYLWAEYLPDDVVRDFEKEHGCRVQVDTYNSNEEMFTKVASGSCGYDIVCPSPHMVTQMILTKLLAPLDHAAIPNRKNIDPRFRALRADPEASYIIPYLGASTGIGYHRQTVPTAPARWADLFDANYLETIKGAFSVLDDARETPAIALLALGHSPNTSSVDEIHRAGEILQQQKPFLACYDSEAFEDKIASGMCRLAHGYAGDFVSVMNDDPNIAYILPTEGSVFNMDCLCVLAESSRKPAAYQFLDFILRPDIAAHISHGTGYPTANEPAAKLIRSDLRDHPCFQIPPDNKLIMLDWAGPEARKAYADVWQKVKIG
jgi:spermidine/putrescine transport system substrate-binding protein